MCDKIIVSHKGGFAVRNIITRLNIKEYKDRVYACWLGKNIGGTIGGPYEGRKEILDIKGFATDAGIPLPNDDLDLQLVWLHAVEKLGINAIKASTLGEFWLSFIPTCIFPRFPHAQAPYHHIRR